MLVKGIIYAAVVAQRLIVNFLMFWVLFVL